MSESGFNASEPGSTTIPVPEAEKQRQGEPKQGKQASRRGVILLNSGGLDSLVSAGWFIKEGFDVRSVMFDYGNGQYYREFHAASRWIDELNSRGGPITLQVIPLYDYYRLVAKYDCVTGKAGAKDVTPVATFVPGRNIVFLLMAAVLAFPDENIRILALSSHLTDRVAGDCRPDFIRAFEEALNIGMGTLGHRECYRVMSALEGMTKAQAVKLGVELDLPLHMSWSCYGTGGNHCGVCHNCLDRKEAFRLANVKDWTDYAV